MHQNRTQACARPMQKGLSPVGTVMRIQVYKYSLKLSG